MFCQHFVNSKLNKSLFRHLSGSTPLNVSDLLAFLVRYSSLNSAESEVNMIHMSLPQSPISSTSKSQHCRANFSPDLITGSSQLDNERPPRTVPHTLSCSCSNRLTSSSVSNYPSETFQRNIFSGSGDAVERQPEELTGASETRGRRRDTGWPAGPGGGKTGAEFPCPGRVVLCLWRVMMSEVALFEYSLETLTYHFLKEMLPRFTFSQLTSWYNDPSGASW
ncbi:unnamed protein product [Protopolystoma xenopodis]|uniref:Uncharacterized protein n=1 Tax=Protopolystoma xenopodis TaxID=117903 RepID=A0A3S5CFX5_9PLAT|nr:unnamed protein product [Protopolystoma xenopodis]